MSAAAPDPAPADVRASTQPQREPRWGLWLMATLGLLVLALLLAGRWRAAAAAAPGAAVAALSWWRERARLLRLARAAEAMAALDLPLLILDSQDRVRWASAAYARLYPGLGQVPVG